MKVEYRVRPVIRFEVTRYQESEPSDANVQANAMSTGKGIFDNAHIAYEVGYALCKDEHSRLGYPPGDERISYPDPQSSYMDQGKMARAIQEFASTPASTL